MDDRRARLAWRARGRRSARSAPTATTISPRSSTTKQRSASPSKASPMSAPTSRTLACRSTQVRRVDRVGLVVGEAAVELEVHRRDVERQVGEHLRHGEAAHAVAGVDDDLQRPDVADPRHQALAGRPRTRRAGRGSVTVPGVPSYAGTPASTMRADVGQAAVLADRRGAGAAQLDAVVLRRVVAGGEHRAGHVEAAGGEVEQVGRAEPGLDDVGALARSRRRRTRRPARARSRACRRP